MTLISALPLLFDLLARADFTLPPIGEAVASLAAVGAPPHPPDSADSDAGTGALAAGAGPPPPPALAVPLVGATELQLKPALDAANSLNPIREAILLLATSVNGAANNRTQPTSEFRSDVEK